MRTELEEHEGRIIWQADFLSGEYLPEKVIGRKEQKRKLRMCLSPMKEGQAPLNAWLYGPTGTGKTALARAVVREICQDSSDRFAFYVNCWARRSLYSAVQAMTDSQKVLGAEAQDTNVKLERIRQVIKQGPVVVILDDIDRVAPSERERIIYTLLGLPHAGVVCISNRRETLLTLEERTGSRLSPTVISCPRYSALELEEILLQRARDGLSPDTWSEAVLTRLARVAGGDARIAIQRLRQAAVDAESRGEKRFTMSRVPEAVIEPISTRKEGTVSRMSYHERLIYELTLKNEPILTTDLRRIYGNHCQDRGITPVARRTFSKYVRFLGDCGLVDVDQRSTAGKGRLLKVGAT